MTTTVVCNEVPPNCHPLGPENKLVFSPGLMAGSAAASSGRISVGCKSPLTGTIKESNSGGTGGQFMARLGYAAIIIEGERKTDDLWKIVITKDSVTFEKCNEYRMLSNYPLVAALQEKYGMEPGYVTIGTAGEMLMCNSTSALPILKAGLPAMPGAAALEPSWAPRESRLSCWTRRVLR